MPISYVTYYQYYTVIFINVFQIQIEIFFKIFMNNSDNLSYFCNAAINALNKIILGCRNLQLIAFSI